MNGQTDRWTDGQTNKQIKVPFGALPKKEEKKMRERKKTRPDTRQSNRGRLGRSCNAEAASNSKMLQDGTIDRPTNTARFTVACPQLKMTMNAGKCLEKMQANFGLFSFWTTNF